MITLLIKLAVYAGDLGAGKFPKKASLGDTEFPYKIVMLRGWDHSRF